MKCGFSGFSITCGISIGKTALILSTILTLMIGCADASRTPCKVTKPRKSKPLMTQDAMDNEKWHCIALGIDAKSKGTVWICTNKLDGARVQVTPIP